MEESVTFLHPGKFHLGSRKSVRLPDLPVERFDHRIGLTSLQVHKTVISGDGRLWAATPAGLACYDGIKARMFGRKHGLANHGLRTLAIHPSTGELWIGTDIGIEVLDISEGAPKSLWSNPLGTVNSLGLQKDSVLIGSSQGLMFCRHTTQLTPLTGFNAANDTVEKILAGTNGSYWVIGSGSGLSHISKNGSNIRFSNDYRIIGKPSCLSEGPAGSVFVGGKHGLIQLDKEGTLKANRILPAPVEAILWDRGQVWLAYDQSVVSLPVDHLESTITKTHLNKVVVKHIQADRFDNIWLSTSGQALLKVSRFRNTFVDDFPTNTGHILSIYHDRESRLIGGSNGLALSNGEIILENLEVWDVLKDDQNKIWSATDKGLYCTPNPHLSFAYKQADCPVIQAPCRALIIFQNRLYVASIRGLARLDPDGVKEIRGPQDKSFGYVYSLHIGPDEALWIATLGQGVFRFDGQNMQSIPLPLMSETANVYAMTHDSSGCLYFAHDNKITRQEPTGQSQVLYETENSVAAWSLDWMSGGNLVAGSSNGLIFINDSSGKIRHLISGNFEDIPWEFTTSRSLAIVDGTVYCGLGSGLRSVKVANLIPKNEAPVARLANMVWRGAEWNTTGNAVYAGNWHLKIELSTEWFLDSCQMRYRLNGFDTDWSDYSNVGPIHYTSLPAGKYSLDVELKSPLVGSGGTSRITEIEILSQKLAEKG